MGFINVFRNKANILIQYLNDHLNKLTIKYFRAGFISNGHGKDALSLVFTT